MRIKIEDFGQNAWGQSVDKMGSQVVGLIHMRIKFDTSQVQSKYTHELCDHLNQYTTQRCYVVTTSQIHDLF